MKGMNGKLLALCASALLFYGCDKEEDALVSSRSGNQVMSQECDMISFEGQTGYRTTVESDGGRTINVAGISRDENDNPVNQNRAMIFDSENWTGDDDDLATTDWGNVLISQQLGYESAPNDNQWGAELRLTFLEPVTLRSMRVLDIDPYEHDSWAFVYVEGEAEPRKIYLEPHGDNVGFTVDFGNIQNVLKLVIWFDGDGAYGSGAIDNVVFCVPVPEQEYGCTRTQGYWKTHSGVDNGKGNGKGKTKYDATWNNYLNSTLDRLGSTTYPHLLWMEPKGGDANLILAHQFIAAELNVASGASIPGDVLAVWLKAQAYFAGDREATRSELLDWAEMLDDYNNGMVGPGHCD